MRQRSQSGFFFLVYFTGNPVVSATSLFELCASQHVDKTKRRGKVLAAQEGETARFLHCLVWFCWGSILHATTPPLRVMRAARFTCSWLELCVTYEQFRFSGREARFLRSDPPPPPPHARAIESKASLPLFPHGVTQENVRLVLLRDGGGYDGYARVRVLLCFSTPAWLKKASVQCSASFSMDLLGGKNYQNIGNRMSDPISKTITG